MIFLSKTIKNNQKQSKTIKNNEKQWKTIKTMKKIESFKFSNSNSKMEILMNESTLKNVINRGVEACCCYMML